MKLDDSRLPFLLCGGLSLSLVVFAILLTEFMRLTPCPLCVWQRILYLLIALLSGLGLLMAGRPVRRLLAVLIASVAAAGASIAGYQSWLQRISPATPCGGAEPWWEAFIRWAGERVPLLFKASGSCSDPAWVFLGLSMAEWSLLCFLALLLVSLHGALRRAPAA